MELREAMASDPRKLPSVKHVAMKARFFTPSRLLGAYQAYGNLDRLLHAAMAPC